MEITWWLSRMTECHFERKDYSTANPLNSNSGYTFWRKPGSSWSEATKKQVVCHQKMLSKRLSEHQLIAISLPKRSKYSWNSCTDWSRAQSSRRCASSWHHGRLSIWEAICLAAKYSTSTVLSVRLASSSSSSGVPTITLRSEANSMKNHGWQESWMTWWTIPSHTLAPSSYRPNRWQNCSTTAPLDSTSKAIRRHPICSDRSSTNPNISRLQ